MKFSLFPAEGLDSRIADAAEWYEFKQRGLGLKFIEDWESSVDYLLRNPYSYQKKHKHFRYAYLKIFPHVIVYEIEQQLVIIYDVVHAKQHPKKRLLKIT